MSALHQLHHNSARPFVLLYLFSSLFLVHLTTAGLTDDVEHTPPQSPHTQRIIQALVREVKKHTEGLDNDVQMTNEKIGVWRPHSLPPTPNLGQWRHMLLVSTPALLLY
jgi:hypothetical protein